MFRLVSVDTRLKYGMEELTAVQRSPAASRAGNARLRLHLQAQDPVRSGHHLYVRRPIRQQDVRFGQTARPSLYQP